MFIVILIFVIVRYLQQLISEQSRLLALIGLLLTLFYVVTGWPHIAPR